MNYELTTIIGLGSIYLILLFGIAFITDRGWIPDKIVHHPVTYVLSLGVFASVWAYYTSVGNAQRDGYGYLANSIGISLAFLFSPLLLKPIPAHNIGNTGRLISRKYSGRPQLANASAR